MISINRLIGRRSKLTLRKWLMDSGAFTTLATHGRYLDEPEVYANRIWEWRNVGELLAAVSQDFMCEPFMLEKTGGTVALHQQWAVERYDRILAELRRLEGRYATWRQRAPHLMPVLQGYEPEDYVAHIRAYGDRLTPGMWVGVGSVCKRNASPQSVLAVLRAIHAERPDLKLHGFGLKITALRVKEIRDLLHTSDSMAWSYNARMRGGDANSWREAAAYVAKIDEILAEIEGTLAA